VIARGTAGETQLLRSTPKGRTTPSSPHARLGCEFALE
jgi:hypothetical protein